MNSTAKKQNRILLVTLVVILSAAAILAWRSVLNGGAYYDIPDFSKEEERCQHENDLLSPFASEDSGNLISRKAN